MTHRTWKSLLTGAGALLLTGSLVLAHGHGKGRTKIDFRLMIGDPTSSRLFAKIDVGSAISSNSNLLAFDKENGHGKGGSKHGNHGNGKGHGNDHGNASGDDNGGDHGNGNKGNKGNDDNDNDDDDDDDHGMTSNGNAGHHHGKSGNFALSGSTITLTIGSATFTGTADNKGRVSTPFNAKLTADGNILQIMANGLNLEELFPIDPTDGSHQVTVEIKVEATTVATSTTASQTITLSDQNVTFFYKVDNGRAMGRNF
jgi:hypothetical protein